MFTITPMVVAKGPSREKSRFTYLHSFGEKIDIPYMSWLIQGNGMNVLFDGGCSADDFRTHIRPKDSSLMLAGERFQDVVDIIPIEQQLQQRGLRLDDIDIFIQSHLDWDHCMNTRKFTKSRILIQKHEWEHIPANPFFTSTNAPRYIYEEIASRKTEFVDGDYDITKGLSVLSTPGHSLGGQSVVVDTERGRYVIAGMCTIRENFYPPEEVLAHAAYRVIPPGMHVNPINAYDSMLRLLDVGGDNVLAFHDSAGFTMGTIG